MKKQIEFKLYLAQYLKKKQIENSLFSMRSFANFLSIEASYFSKLLNGKRPFPNELIEDISLKLKIPDTTKENFIKLNTELNTNFIGKLKKRKNIFNNLEKVEFETIKDPIYYTFLESLKIENKLSNIDKIQDSLKLNNNEIDKVIETLTILKMIQVDDNEIIDLSEWLHFTYN